MAVQKTGEAHPFTLTKPVFILALTFFLILAPGLSAQERILTLDEALEQLSQAQPAQAAAELRWDPLLRSGVISLSGHNAAFNTGSPGEKGLILLDSRRILEVPAPYLDQGLLCFPASFVSTLKTAWETAILEDLTRFRIAAIVVDPGHGGKDVGAVGTHTVNGRTLRAVEKDITLRASQMLHARLSAAYPDKQVLLTRTGDTYPTLDDRVAMANAVSLKENEAIVFISIHANASFNKDARGYEVWYLSPDYRRDLIDRDRYSPEILPILSDMIDEEFTRESLMIARNILDRLKETMGNTMPSRGIKAEEWFVVRNALMPSVLVELGFVTNEEDAILMTSDTHLRNLSEALYKGIADFVTTFEGQEGSP
jgi:N-acetylmuramoyl-L-alanine amidase